MIQAPAQYQGLRVREQGEKGTKLLFVPHSGGELTFLHPPYGPNSYAKVGLAIVQHDLKRPTMAETASLVHAAFNSDDRYSTEIKDIMWQAWMWAFTGTLYVPKEGAFIQDDPEIRDGMPFMNLDDLVRKLNAHDPSVRHVPFGYKVGEMKPLELAKNPYVIGLAGAEGAEQLARVADKHSNKPYLSSLESVDGNATRVSALYSRNLGRRLYVLGYIRDNLRNSRAFGVFEKTQK